MTILTKALVMSLFQPIPLVDESNLYIERFTRSHVHEYFGEEYDLFSDVWGVLFMETPWQRLIVGCDPRWGRCIYSVSGYANFRSFGENYLEKPWDITGKYPYVFITDRGKKLVAQFKLEPPPHGDSVPRIEFVRYIGATSSGGIWKTFRGPDGIAYSDAGTPNDPSDDFILVTDALDNSLYAFYVATGTMLGSHKARWSYPVDVAVGKEVSEGRIRNTDDVYILNEGGNKIVRVELATGDTQEFRFPDDLNFHVYSIETDACGRVYVSCSDDTLYVLEFLPAGPVIREKFPGPPFNKIHDVYVSGNEVIVSERWTDNTGISLYRITDGCAEDTCMLAVRITDPRDKQVIRADSIPVKGEVLCKSHPDPGYGFVKYWALYIAPGWDIVGEFAFLAGSPGGTDGVDTLCWLVADTFPAGQYTLLLRAQSNEGLEKEDKIRIRIMHGAYTDPTIIYLRRPDGTYWYPMMEIAPVGSPVEVGWRIVGPAGKLRFRLSTNNGVSYQDISGWLPPGTLIDDSTYEGSWVWNTPNFPSRKVKLLMEVYDTAGEYSSSCEIAPAIVVVSDVGGITAGNGGRKLALSEDGVMHGVWATGKIIRDTMNPGPEDIQSSVYYSYSTDLGMSWAPPKLVALGRDPAIALFDNGSAGMVYLSDKADTLYYRPINKAGNPGKPTVLNVGARLYGSPAITIRGGRAYTVAEVYDSASALLFMWELRKQGQLVQTAEMAGPWQETPANPLEVVAVPIGGKREATDTVYYVLLNPRGSPSVATDITGRLHLAWDRGPEIWYGRETDTGWVFAQVSDSGVLASDPCLDVHGGNAYITWKQMRMIDRVLVRRYGFVQDGFWLAGTDTVVRYFLLNRPVIDKGGAIAWTMGQEVYPGPQRTVNILQYETETGGWTGGGVLSNYPLGDHPQLEVARKNLTAAWSQGYWEMNPLWSRPMGRFYLGTELLNQDQPPFWWVELGDSEATPYTVHRGGFTVYSSGVRADVDSAYLAYKFPLFGSSESEIWLKLYYDGDEDWRGVSVRVNDQDFGNFWYPKGETIWARCEPGVAESLNIVVNNIGGSEVSIAGIYVYSASEGKAEAAGLAGDVSGLPIVLSLNAPYPNPAKGRVTLSYAIPGQHEGQNLSIRLYDVSGRRIQSLVEDKAKAGVFTISLARKDLPTGLYFVVLRVGQEQRVQKLMWVR
ncbi:MAG: T9SS type A sorting domain-containing protein [candidate division WOR-3 bacterium]